MKYFYFYPIISTILAIIFCTIAGDTLTNKKEQKSAVKDNSTPTSETGKDKVLGKGKDIEGIYNSSEELAAQQRPKRGYYFYGHPHSPNFFDRYFDREDKQKKRRLKQQGDKMINKFRHRTNNRLDSTGDESSNDGDVGIEPEDDLETAGAFWNLFSVRGSGGRGHGGGGYGSYGGGYGKGVNKSAVGLLGFLSLLSLIQSGLTTTTTAAAGRRRRDAEGLSSEIGIVDGPSTAEQEKEAQNRKIADIVLPLLTSFSYAVQDEQTTDQKLKCVLNEVCVSNYALVSEFGEHGKDVGLMLGNVLESMAKKRQKYRYVDTNNELLQKLRYAARAGRNQRNCSKNYPKCEAN